MQGRAQVLVVIVAAAAAGVLTVRCAARGGVELALDAPAARADPGPPATAHDLSALAVFNLTLVRAQERYVDPSRLVPRRMLYEALDWVQLLIPEIVVEPDGSHDRVAITIRDQRKVFDTSGVNSLFRLAANLKRIFHFIETNGAGIDLARVEYAATNGMLSTLDPQSVLIEPEPVRRMAASTSGVLGGIGMVIQMIDHKLTVVRAMKNAPASLAGIKPRDRIVRINQDLTENITVEQAIERIQGPIGSGVTLWIERAGSPGPLRFDLKRAIIYDVSPVTRLRNGVGVIRIRQFTKSITAEVAAAMKVLSSTDTRAWVLDLRGNPGGVLEQAVQLTDRFVSSGTVTTTEWRGARESRQAQSAPDDTSSPLVVLVDTATASGAELVAAALKDLDRAVIVGARTYGNSTVQEIFDNSDGSKLKLTVAQWLTPSDRSVQAIGIVPDIALRPMSIPARNQGPDDVVRLLAPTGLRGEAGLGGHLSSVHARDTDTPVFEIGFQPAHPTSAPGSSDDQDDPATDVALELASELAVSSSSAAGSPRSLPSPSELASELAVSSSSATRSGLLKHVQPVVARIEAEQERRLISSLGVLGVDWSAAPAKAAGGAALDVRLSIAPAGAVNAGDVVTVTATAKNTGSDAAWRVLARLHCDDGVFDDRELPIGKIAPGETRAFSSQIQIPRNALDRVDRIAVELREARGTQAVPAPVSLRINAAARPMFAYAYQLVDDGNGDGLVQKGENYRLVVSIKNTGDGPSPGATVLLRNASGAGVTLDKGRFELSELAPGATRELAFPLRVTPELGGDQLELELEIYDAVLDVAVSEKLRVPVQPALPLTPGTGSVMVRAAQAEIRSGASANSVLIGSTNKGAAFSLLGTVGPWTKIDLGGDRPGFLRSTDVERGSGAPSFTPRWQATPPSLALALGALETSADRYPLKGTIMDDSGVEDMYIRVSNPSAKVRKKVYYRSNRKTGHPLQMDFDVSVPLWPGANEVTVVAHDTSHVFTRKMLVITARGTTTH